MRKDLKIGMAIGVIIVVLAIVFIAPPEDQTKSLPPVETSPPAAPTAPQTVPAPPEAVPPAVVAEPIVVTPGPPPAPPTEQIQPAPTEKPVFVVVPPPQQQETPPRYHVVVEGDTLSRIAEKYYGQERFANEIFKANRNIIKNPDLLHIGWKLRIPSAEEIASKKNP